RPRPVWRGPEGPSAGSHGGLTSLAMLDGGVVTDIARERAAEKRSGLPPGGRASAQAAGGQWLGRSLALPNADPHLRGGTRSRAEGDKRIERSKRWRRLASAAEWLAGEAKPPGVNRPSRVERWAGIALASREAQVPLQSCPYGKSGCF